MYGATSAKQMSVSLLDRFARPLAGGSVPYGIDSDSISSAFCYGAMVLKLLKYKMLGRYRLGLWILRQDLRLYLDGETRPINNICGWCRPYGAGEGSWWMWETIVSKGLGNIGQNKGR